MKTVLLATFLTAGLAVPAFAQSDMSCADFMAMDADGQMKAMAMMAGDDMMADDMMADDNNAGDEMMADDMAKEEMAGDDMMGDDMMAEEATVEAAGAACADHGDMTVEDAMSAM